MLRTTFFNHSRWATQRDNITVQNSNIRNKITINNIKMNHNLNSNLISSSIRFRHYHSYYQQQQQQQQQQQKRMYSSVKRKRKSLRKKKQSFVSPPNSRNTSTTTPEDLRPFFDLVGAAVYSNVAFPVVSVKEETISDYRKRFAQEYEQSYHTNIIRNSIQLGELPDNFREIKIGENRIYLVGTAHQYFNQSLKDVKGLIGAVSPDTVVVEVDDHRITSTLMPTSQKSLFSSSSTSSSLLRSGTSAGETLANGSDMRAAVIAAGESNATVCFGDRRGYTTLRRFLSLPWSEKNRGWQNISTPLKAREKKQQEEKEKEEEEEEIDINDSNHSNINRYNKNEKHENNNDSNNNNNNNSNNNSNNQQQQEKEKETETEDTNDPPLTSQDIKALESMEKEIYDSVEDMMKRSSATRSILSKRAQGFYGVMMHERDHILANACIAALRRAEFKKRGKFNSNNNNNNNNNELFENQNQSLKNSSSSSSSSLSSSSSSHHESYPDHWNQGSVFRETLSSIHWNTNRVLSASDGNEYNAEKQSRERPTTIVAVMGCGHLSGVEEIIRKEVADNTVMRMKETGNNRNGGNNSNLRTNSTTTTTTTVESELKSESMINNNNNNNISNNNNFNNFNNFNNNNNNDLENRYELLKPIQEWYDGNDISHFLNEDTDGLYDNLSYPDEDESNSRRNKEIDHDDEEEEYDDDDDEYYDDEEEEEEERDEDHFMKDIPPFKHFPEPLFLYDGASQQTMARLWRYVSMGSMASAVLFAMYWLALIYLMFKGVSYVLG